MAGESSIAWVQFAGPPLNPMTSCHDLTGSPLPGLSPAWRWLLCVSLAVMQADATATTVICERTRVKSVIPNGMTTFSAKNRMT